MYRDLVNHTGLEGWPSRLPETPNPSESKWSSCRSSKSSFKYTAIVPAKENHKNRVNSRKESRNCERKTAACEQESFKRSAAAGQNLPNHQTTSEPRRAKQPSAAGREGGITHSDAARTNPPKIIGGKTRAPTAAPMMDDLPPREPEACSGRSCRPARQLESRSRSLEAAGALRIRRGFDARDENIPSRWSSNRKEYPGGGSGERRGEKRCVSRGEGKAPR